MASSRLQSGLAQTPERHPCGGTVVRSFEGEAGQLLGVIPSLFLATMVGALSWFLHLRKARPDVMRMIGNTETKMLEGG